MHGPGTRQESQRYVRGTCTHTNGKDRGRRTNGKDHSAETMTARRNGNRTPRMTLQRQRKRTREPR